MYVVKAGHRYVSLERVALAEDANEEPAPRKLPDGVLRVTVCGGRTVDFDGAAADVMRLHLGAVALKSPGPEEAAAKVGLQVRTPAPLLPDHAPARE